jgi:hypothetical protein
MPWFYPSALRFGGQTKPLLKFRGEYGVCPFVLSNFYDWVRRELHNSSLSLSTSILGTRPTSRFCVTGSCDRREIHVDFVPYVSDCHFCVAIMQL